MRQQWVIGNWKMHGSLLEVQQLLDALKSRMPTTQAVNCAVCPPVIYLPAAAALLKDSVIALGAQNICAESATTGAYTGEISAAMLNEFSVQLVLVGHSERRQYYGETDQVVAQKFSQVQQSGMVPVLCVGETLAERESGQTLDVVAKQIEAIIELHGIAALAKAIIAYEPVWAIGTGLTASPEQAQEVHAFIRQLLGRYDQQAAESIALLYGGSVNGGNAKALFAMRDIDGALVGGASLKADEFSAICEIAE